MSYVTTDLGKLLFYALLAILLGLALCYREAGILWRNHQIEGRGLLADARIVERSSEKQDDDINASLFVTLNFVPEGGKRLNTVVNVSHEFLLAHAAPSLTHVQVRYLREDPSIAAIVGEPRGWTKTGTGLLMIIAGIAGIGGVIWVYRLDAGG